MEFRTMSVVQTIGLLLPLALTTSACGAERPTATSPVVVQQTSQSSPANASGAVPANNPYLPEQPATSSAQDQGDKKDDLQAFATGGTKILNSEIGDIAGKGRADALLVLDPPTNGTEKLGEGPPRIVLILIRNAAGQLQKVAQNDKIVPCANCGGIAGDPFGYVRLVPGGFTVVNGGGGREHWTDEYTFKYSSAQKDWLLEEATHRVVDRVTGKEKHQSLTTKDLGTIKFKDFDPSTLPDADLP